MHLGDHCIAVGDSFDSGDTATWRSGAVHPVGGLDDALPAGAAASRLGGVSCSTAQACRPMEAGVGLTLPRPRHLSSVTPFSAAR